MLEDVSLHTRQKLILQLDGEPAHFAVDVRSYMDRKFPKKWIEGGGPVAWPSKFPELTPMEFFWWGYVKSEVYKTQPTTIEDMKQRIRGVFQTIIPNMLSNVRKSFEKRVTECIQQDGREFEHFL